MPNVCQPEKIKQVIFDNEAHWYKDTKRLSKLCLGCGEVLEGAIHKSLGVCINCQVEMVDFGVWNKLPNHDMELNKDKWGKFVQSNNPYIGDFINYSDWK
jgi:hypothetical protein